MTTFRHALIFVPAALLLTRWAKPADSLRASFADPGAEYRPVPFWHLERTVALYDEIVRQLEDAKTWPASAARPCCPFRPGGSTASDRQALPGHGAGLSEPGVFRPVRGDAPDLGEARTEADRVRRHRFPERYGRRPTVAANIRAYTRKLLENGRVSSVRGPATVHAASVGRQHGNTALHGRLGDGDRHRARDRSISGTAVRDGIRWRGRCRPARGGSCSSAAGTAVRPLVDYMEHGRPSASAAFRIDLRPNTAKRFGQLLRRQWPSSVSFTTTSGSTCRWRGRWTPAITGLFEKSATARPCRRCTTRRCSMTSAPETGRRPRGVPYGLRAELMAEGYPRQVARVVRRSHGLSSIGHPPGNYCTKITTDMHGDILKFYRHTQIPLTDYIFYYGHGRDGLQAGRFGGRPVRPAAGRGGAVRSFRRRRWTR